MERLIMKNYENLTVQKFGPIRYVCVQSRLVGWYM